MLKAQLGMVAHTYNLSTQDIEAHGSSEVPWPVWVPYKGGTLKLLLNDVFHSNSFKSPNKKSKIYTLFSSRLGQLTSRSCLVPHVEAIPPIVD